MSITNIFWENRKSKKQPYYLYIIWSNHLQSHLCCHDDIILILCKFYPHYWQFVRGSSPSRIATSADRISISWCHHHRRILFVKGQLCDVGCFFVVNLNKLLNGQSSCRWFEMPWRSCDFTLIWLNDPKITRSSSPCQIIVPVSCDPWSWRAKSCIIKFISNLLHRTLILNITATSDCYVMVQWHNSIKIYMYIFVLSVQWCLVLAKLVAEATSISSARYLWSSL